MVRIPEPAFLTPYWHNSFELKQHLQNFLHLESENLDLKLAAGVEKMAELGEREFNWQQADTFYREQVGNAYLFDLSAWHLSRSQDIENTLLLIADHARGQVLDFGGGIGTHAICAALCPQVERVIYCDLNPIHHDFVRYRAECLGLTDKIVFCFEMPGDLKFDTVVCFDVVEHLPDPCQQLRDFHQSLSPDGKAILNWYFYKGYANEYPFHLDDPQVIDEFLTIVQSNFLEVFHPYFTTARCYRKNSIKKIAGE
jgi:2-polyprenyl-3-methyl-5-hydroxy-6-metoxy-1,4-benzoquinol methylase